MGYATLARLRGMLGRVELSATSKPVNEADAQQFIDDHADEINAALNAAGVGTVPVTAPASYVDRLALLNSYGAASMVIEATFPGEAFAPVAGSRLWEQRYKDGIKAIRNGSDIPPELLDGFASPDVAPMSYFEQHPDQEAEYGTLADAHLFGVADMY